MRESISSRPLYQSPWRRRRRRDGINRAAREGVGDLFSKIHPRGNRARARSGEEIGAAAREPEPVNWNFDFNIQDRARDATVFNWK
jgi:hypothetical protein